MAAFQQTDGVLFGSYPFFGEAAGPRVIVTLESASEERVDAAKEFLLARVRPEWVLRVADDDVLDKAAEVCADKDRGRGGQEGRKE